MKKFTFHYPDLNSAGKEIVFVVESHSKLTKKEKEKVSWILNPNYHLLNGHNGHLVAKAGEEIKYVGPNLRCETPESEKFRAICEAIGLTKVAQIEEFIAHSVQPGILIPFDQMRQDVHNELPSRLILDLQPEPTRIIPLIELGIKALKKESDDKGWGFDDFDLQYYYDLFVKKLKRNPTDVEIAQIAQGNSSHSRHWEFMGNLEIDGVKVPKSLMELAKSTIGGSPHQSIVAFKDNGGVIKGGWVDVMVTKSNGEYTFVRRRMNLTSTAETHNHPSGIEPFQGAATGKGGMLRDLLSMLRGSLLGFGGLYFHTGRHYLRELIDWKYSPILKTPLEVRVGAILGASHYGNAAGHPMLLFDADSTGIILPNGERFENHKPNIYVSGWGMIPNHSKPKAIARKGMMVVCIGGAIRRIGTGGSSASSTGIGENNAQFDFNSVQRGEPMTGRCAFNVIEDCVLREYNPIAAINDQGAGGLENVLTELINPSGAIIYLRRTRIADASLSQVEIWISENQERFGLLVEKKDLGLFQEICDTYECHCEVVGEVNQSARIVVIDEKDDSTPVDLPLPEILGDLPKKSYSDNTVKRKFKPLIIPKDSALDILKKVAQVASVDLLYDMVDHFDGSVSGRVVQGPRVGAYQIPMCKYGIQSCGFIGTSGTLGTQTRTTPVSMLIDEGATSRMLLAEKIIGLSMVYIPGGLEKVKGRMNVMWPFKVSGMKAKLYYAYVAVVDALKEVSIALNGGKDSLSMKVDFENNTVIGFPQLVMQAEAFLLDFRNRLTPELKGNSNLVLIELEKNKFRMGGSAIAEAYSETGTEIPDADMRKTVKLFSFMQDMIKKGKLLSGSSKLKGGVLSTVSKMTMASTFDVRLNIPKGVNSQKFYFNEEIGVIVECEKDLTEEILQIAHERGLVATKIGSVKAGDRSLTFLDGNKVCSLTGNELWHQFRDTSKLLKGHMGIPKKLLERETLSKQNYKLTFDPYQSLLTDFPKGKIYPVAVLAAPGTNGQIELAFPFAKMKDRFKVTKIQMKQLRNGTYDLKNFDVVLFAGGFPYGDVGGAGKGWAATILFNPKLKKMFKDFFARKDTLSFGVCNGFQLATFLGVLDGSIRSTLTKSVNDEYQQAALVSNDSKQFEHRLVSLLIPGNTRAIMFKGMEGSVLPAWGAHAQGNLKLLQADPNKLLKKGLVAVQYADSNGNPTEDYGPNPNGSKKAIAGLTTLDGRHTFMMPHIERVSASNDHLPYRPKDWDFKNPVWQRSYENMYIWLSENVK